jgi:hypothetical protein
VKSAAWEQSGDQKHVFSCSYLLLLTVEDEPCRVKIGAGTSCTSRNGAARDMQTVKSRRTKRSETRKYRCSCTTELFFDTVRQVTRCASSPVAYSHLYSANVLRDDQQLSKEHTKRDITNW